MNHKVKIFIFNTVLAVLAVVFSGCGKTQTYAEMLKQESESIDKFLSYGGRFTAPIPSNVDEILATGDRLHVSNTVPFYELSNGVYMQPVNKGNGTKITTTSPNNKVAFRFLRINLNTWASNPYEIEMFSNTNGGVGNYYYSDIKDYYFFYDPVYTASSSQYYTYGMGIEYPLAYLTDESACYLVIPSQMGFSDGVSSVVPYLYYVEYYIISK